MDRNLTPIRQSPSRLSGIDAANGPSDLEPQEHPRRQRAVAAVPRFFFHLRENNMLLRDEEGRELPDLSADHAVAVMSAPSILCDEVLSGRVSLNGAIDVRDEEGAQVETVKFSQAVVIEAEVTEPVRS